MADETTIQQPPIEGPAPIPQETPQSDPPTKKMYDLLVKGQLYSKSYDDFQKQYSTPESIDKLYNGLNGAQLYSKSKDDFYSQYFPSTKTASVKQTEQPSIENIRQLKDAANIQDPVIASPLGGINTSEVDPEIAAKKQALKDQSDAHTKTLADQWGLQPDNVQKALDDFPDENDPDRLKAKTQLQVDNPETYDKLVAADQNMHLLSKNGGNEIAHAYNELQGTPEKPINSLTDLQRNISLQQDLIRSNLSGPDQDKALANLEKNRSSAFNATSPEIINEYAANEEIKGQLNPMQFAGLKSLQAFDPQKYKLYSSLISRTDTNDDTVEQKIGMEKVKKELLDIGRKNTSNYLNENQYDLDKSYKNAQTDDEKNNIAQTFLHNKSLTDQMEQDAKQDVSRFPYLNDLEFERQAKELAGSPDMGPIGYALNKFGRGIGSAVKAVQNVDVNTFGSDQDISQLNAQRLGESAKEQNQFYLPEGYKAEGSPYVYKFDKELQDQATKIKNDKSLTDEQKSGALIDLVKENPDQVHTVTNTAKYGKSASIFSKATLYKNAGMIGDLASFAAQQAGTGGMGLPKWIASAAPMFIATQNDFYKQALEEGRPNPMEYANTHAAIMMAAGAINPDLDIVKRSLGLKSELGKAIAGVSEGTWNDIINKNKPLINRIKNSLSGVGKETAKMGLTYGAGTSIASDLANRGLFGSNISADEMVDHAVKATKDITTSSIALMGLHAISNFKDVSPEEKARVWELGDNPKLAIERLDDSVKAGDITGQVADQRKAIIKKVSKLIDSVPTENAKGKPLTDQQRANYLYNLIIKDKADDIKSDLPDAQKEKLEGTKRAVDIENNAILDPKSEKENLMQRKRELTDLLSPDAEGKSTLTPLEKKTHQTELDDINEKLYSINSPKTEINGQETKDANAPETERERQIEKPEDAGSSMGVTGPSSSLLESRHADTPRDERGITSGQDHSGLSEDGIADANKLAESVKDKGVMKVISSDLERGKETAKIVADKLGAKVEHDPNLRAWDLGGFDGTKDKDWKELQRYFVEHPGDKKLGESLSDEGYATKFLNKDDFKKWNDLDLSKSDEANKFIKSKRENEKSINESFNEYKDRVIKAREGLEKEGPSTLLINHSNNMMLWDAYEKNGRQWNDKTSQDYLNGEKPKPAKLTNKKPRISVSTPNIVNVKLKENALQEPSNEGILQRQPEQDRSSGSGRGQMEPGEQGTVPAGESGQQSQEENQGTGQEEGAIKPPEHDDDWPFIEEPSDNEFTSIKNAVTEQKVDEAGLLPAMKEAKRDFGTVWSEAQKKIAKGFDIEGLIKKLKAKKNVAVSDLENAMILYHQNIKESQLDSASKELDAARANGDREAWAEAYNKRAKLLDDLQDIYDVDRKIGTATARGLNARKMMADRKFSLINMQLGKRAARGGDPLTEAQLEEVTKQYNEIKKTKEAYENKIAALEAENKKLQSERLITKMQQDVKGEKIKKKAAVIKQDLASNFDELRKIARSQGLSSNPFAPEMIPVIGKIAKNLIRLGINKVEGIVNHIYDELKGDFDGLTPDHVYEALEAAQNKEKLDAYKNRLINATDETEAKTQSKDFSPTRKSAKPVLDRQAFKLKADYERAKDRFATALKEDEQANRSKFDKVADAFVKWERLGKLSSPVTIAKLSMAAITRLAQEPIEEGVGLGYSVLFPKIAAKAEGQGGVNVKALAKGYKEAITTGMKDAWQTIALEQKTNAEGKKEIAYKYGGKSDLEAMFGKQGQLPPEMADYFGHLHGAIKAPVKRFAFERSLEKRLAKNIANGVDVSDPNVQMSLMNSAYKDAQRAIFMQDNFVSKVYQNWVASMEHSKDHPQIGKAAASAFQFLIPFVKVPTNIVGEIGTNIAGLQIAGAKILHTVFTKGLDNLSSDEADFIMRNLKKGTLGTGALLLGYFNPHTFGGFYQDKEKRKPDDVKFGNAKVFGHSIPTWLLESPIFQTMQLGSTIRRVADKTIKGHKEGLPEGIVTGLLSLAKEEPLIDQPIRMGKIFGSKNERQYFLGEMAKSTMDPALLSFIAQSTDPAEKRKPTTVLQHIETGIPGLREKVSQAKK